MVTSFSYSLLLNTVSDEDTQARTDRVMLTPWVKFLWESYRNILELTKNNQTFEKLYTEVAKDGMEYCTHSTCSISICTFQHFISVLSIKEERSFVNSVIQ